MLTRRLVGRRGWVAWALISGGLFVSACSSGDDDDTPPGVGTGNTGNTANRPSYGGSGGGFGDGGMGEGNTGGMGEGDDPLAPVVEVVSPAAETDPNGDGVLVDDELDVVCHATRSPAKAAEDVAAVVVDMLDASGKVVDTVAATDDGTGESNYVARVITAKVPDNGIIGFRCTAADGSTPAHTASDKIWTFIDHGPSVEFSRPSMEDQPIALGAPLKIVFTVTEQPVAAGDDGATIGDVTMTVRDVPFELAEDHGEYSATVHLDDGELFPNTPEGSVPIIVQAANRRTPVASVNEVARHVIVDGTGPVVTITDPKSESVRGGKVTLAFTVVDEESGVDPDSIEVTLNDVPYRYSSTSDDWGNDGDTYTFDFDTTQIQGSIVQATIAVTATDLVGNSAKNEAIVLYLDNQPPIVDLDPPPVRERQKNSDQCSVAFDPVGEFAANDLATVLQLQKFRALVWDLTNDAPGQTIHYYSGTDLDSVVIRLQPNVDQGLLIDTNGDGYCDDLLSEDDSAKPKDLPFQPLKGIPPQGTSWISVASDDPLASEFPMAGCGKYADAASEEPPRLCPPTNTDDMGRAISWDVDSSVPAIFGIGSLEGIACTGTDWEIGPVVNEGWICVAGRAEDHTGNVGISRPLRLCFDDGKAPAPSCANPTDDPPPSCRVDNCKLPPAFFSEHVIVKN